LTNAYNYWVKYRGLEWEKPKFLREDKPILSAWIRAWRINC